ncbi:MAG: SpoIIE family protein phosphatase [Acidobacteriota bacterium]
MTGESTSTVRFRERAELLELLLEVSAAASETLNLDRLLVTLAGVIQKVIPYELLAILLFHEKERVLKIRHAIGHREEIVRNLVVRLGEGITGAAAAAREAILVSDVRQDPRYLSGLDAVRSELAAPMITRGKLVGVIDLQSTRLEAYSEEDRALLRLIASRVAAAIDNARLYRRVVRQNRTLSALAHISRDVSILDLEELLAHIATAVKELINYDAFSILLVDTEQKCLRNRFSMRYDERVQLDNIPLGKGITGAAAESREVIRSENTLADPRYIPFHADIRSEVAVPLIVRGRVVGVMDLESARFANFTEDHVRTLSLLAPQLASSIENARLYEELTRRKERMEKDLEAACEVQAALLCATAPAIEGLEIATGYRPAREISGDLYHFFEPGDGTAMIALGDVSGKGVAAALYGSLISGLLLTLAPRRRSPAALMRALNETLIARRVEARYVSLLVLLWRAAAREAVFTNAGAMPPLICRQGEVLKPRIEGVPLGLLPDAEHQEVAFQTQPGDVVVLYSDGIPDQTNPAGEDYGRERLIRLLRDVCEQPAQGIVDAVFAGLDAFTENAGTFDDQTLLVLRVAP